MEGLFRALPPLSPDYSGVSSLFPDMRALIVIHDGTGCLGNTMLDEPRQGTSEQMIYTTNIRENDVVMGTDEALLEKVNRAEDYMDPRMIVLVGTPVPALIGTDLKALAKTIEKRTGKPCFSFDTNGIGLYDKGVEMACMAQCRKLADEYAQFEESGIAIVGASPIDYGPIENGDILREICTVPGIKTTLIGIGGSETSVGAAARSKLNIAACGAAVPACEYLKEKYGTPYIADLPVGKSGAERLKHRILEELRLDGPMSAEADHVSGVSRVGEGRKALIIHEQLTANALRCCLKDEFGYDDVTVATFFELRDSLAEEGDLHIEGEAGLEKIASQGCYDDVFCDSLLRPAFGRGEVRFIDLPHIAVSSIWKIDEHPPIFGDGMSEYIRLAISSECR